jgi:hypothetical protein
LSGGRFADSVRRIVHLAWPLFIGQVSVVAFASVDTLLVGRHSAADLAALSVGSAAYITVFIGLMGVVLALGPIVGQLYGARQLEQAGRQLHQAVWLALGLGVVGCATSTAIVMWSQAIVAFVVLRRSEFYAPFALWGRGLHAPDRQALRAQLRLGVPMGLSILIEVSGFALMAVFIARLGTHAVAGLLGGQHGRPDAGGGAAAGRGVARHARAEAVGSTSVKTLPPPSRGSQRTPPPWRSAICRTSASPRPTPPAFSACPGRRKKGSKMRSRKASGTPGPRSQTRASTRPPSRRTCSSISPPP